MPIMKRIRSPRNYHIEVSQAINTGALPAISDFTEIRSEVSYNDMCIHNNAEKFLVNSR